MKKYKIYDGENTSLFSNYQIIEEKSGKDAIMTFLKKTGRENYKIKRSGNNDAIFCAMPFFEENGKMYKNGNNVWYKKVIESS